MTTNRMVANVGRIAGSESGVSTSAIGLIMTCLIVIAMIPIYFNLSRSSTEKESLMAALNMAVDTAQRHSLIQPVAGGLAAAPVPNAGQVLQDMANELAANSGGVRPIYVGIFHKQTAAIVTPMLARTSSGGTVLNAASLANVNTASAGVTPGSYFLVAAELDAANVVTASSKVAVAVANMDLAGVTSISNQVALLGGPGNAFVNRELGVGNGNNGGPVITTRPLNPVIITGPSSGGPGVVTGRGGRGGPSIITRGEGKGGPATVDSGTTGTIDVTTGTESPSTGVGIPQPPVSTINPPGRVIPTVEIPTIEVPITGTTGTGDVVDGSSLTTGEPSGALNPSGNTFSGNGEVGGTGIIDNSGDFAGSSEGVPTHH